MMLSVQELLDAAANHDGLDVEVRGILRSGREELSIGADDEDGPRIWLSLRGGEPETKGRLAHGKLVVARGVFRAGPGGHLERFAGELRPVTEVERVKKKDR